MIYTDGLHLTADSLQELTSYASTTGLSPECLVIGKVNLHPRFRIYGKVKQRILSDKCVVQISTRELVQICKLNYVQPQTAGEINEWEAYHGKLLQDVYKPAEKDYDRMFKNIFAACGIEKVVSVKRERLCVSNA